MGLQLANQLKSIIAMIAPNELQTCELTELVLLPVPEVKSLVELSMGEFMAKQGFEPNVVA